MPPHSAPRLPAVFRRLAWFNLSAQCSEQAALAAVPLAAVLMLGMGAPETGYLQTAQTLPFLLLSGTLNLPVRAGLGFLGAAGIVTYSVAAPAIMLALVARGHLRTGWGALPPWQDSPIRD